MGENKFTWLSPPLIHHNGIIIYYLVEFEYELNGEVETIEYIVLPMNPKVTIPYMVTLPYNVTVVPYTIGAGLSAKIVNTDAQPNTGKFLYSTSTTKLFNRLDNKIRIFVVNAGGH